MEELVSLSSFITATGDESLSYIAIVGFGLGFGLSGLLLLVRVGISSFKKLMDLIR